MYIVTGEEMQQIEEEAIRKLAISTRILMEKAGEAVAREVLKMVSRRGEVIVVCGKGNNGGDGFVAARFLHKAGVKVMIFGLASHEELSEDAFDAFRSLNALSIPYEVLDSNTLSHFEASLSRADLLIDAIFGIGLKGAVKGFTSKVIEIINRTARSVISVDVPSGLEVDSGHVHGECVVADKTVTFTCLKVGLVIYPGANFVGDLQLVDLGIPLEIVKGVSTTTLPSIGEIKDFLPGREVDVHKKECGRVLVIAGSLGMTGAATLTSLSALRSGAGVVTLGIPQSLNPIFEQKLTEVMTIPLPETPHRSLDVGAFDKINELLKVFDVLVMGPGLSLNESTVHLVRKLVASASCPLVLDADGLNALVDATEILAKRSTPTIITPHPGELARLFKTTADEVQSDRLGFAKRAATLWNIVVVLKGARSIVSCEEKSTIVPTGNPGMATAGTGDVLTGLIGGFLSQEMTSYNAAVLATYIHGLAGDLAAEDVTPYCLIASDLIDYLPKAIKLVVGSM